MSNIPTTRRAKVLNEGILALAAWLADCLPALSENEEEIIKELNHRTYEIRREAHEANAKDILNCDDVMKCPSCLGNGLIGWETCTESGFDECETCGGTGYLPSTFEP